MTRQMNWNDCANFSEREFVCSETGECDMDPSFMDDLQSIRTEAGFPFPINSGYRSPAHSIEAAKDEPGDHAKGTGADIGVSGERAWTVVRLATARGLTVGINQKGPHRQRFIHVSKRLTPMIWSY